MEVVGVVLVLFGLEAMLFKKFVYVDGCNQVGQVLVGLQGQFVFDILKGRIVGLLLGLFDFVGAIVVSCKCECLIVELLV